MKNSAFYKCKIFFLYLLVFSLPFEDWDPLGIAYIFSVTKFSGLVYVLFSLFNIKGNYSIVIVKRNLQLLFLLWLWLAIQSTIHMWYDTEFGPVNFTLIQCMLLFWLSANDLNNNPKIGKFILLFFTIGVILMCILAQLGVGLEFDTKFREKRITFFGSNSNSIGVYCALASIIIIEFIFNKKRNFDNKSYLLLLSLPSLLLMLSLSGSRGAFLAFIVSAIVFFAFYKTPSSRKILIFIAGTILTAYCVQYVLETDVMSDRVSASLREGNTGGRELIWRNAIDFISESPLFGWGNTGYERKIIQRNGEYIDTHNLFLYLLVTGGIIALFIYLLFMTNVLKRIWLSYKLNGDSLPLALFTFFLITISKTGGVINNKLMWLLLAYSAYSNSRKYLPARPSKPAVQEIAMIPNRAP